MDEKRNITGDLMTVKEAAEGHIALVTDYESLDRSMDRAKEKYLRCKQDFFNSWRWIYMDETGRGWMH